MNRRQLRELRLLPELGIAVEEQSGSHRDFRVHQDVRRSVVRTSIIGVPSSNGIKEGEKTNW